jgi:hypothetical protein
LTPANKDYILDTCFVSSQGVLGNQWRLQAINTIMAGKYFGDKK